MTSNDKAGLSVLYLNSRRIKSCTRTRNKIQQLQDIVSLGDFDIVAITETWLNSPVRDNEILPQCYTVYRRDRQDVHGGVALCVRDNVFSCRRRDLEPAGEEVIVCELKPHTHKNIAIVVVYRPPPGDIERFVNVILSTFRDILNLFDHTCTVCDFNLPHINWVNCSSHSQRSHLFCDLVNAHSLLQAEMHNQKCTAPACWFKTVCSPNCILLKIYFTYTLGSGVIGKSDHVSLNWHC